MSLFHAALQPALDANGGTISGATWNFYRVGGLTPANVYADASLSTSLGSQVTANAAGRFVTIFLDDTVPYRAILKDAGGATIDDIANVNGTGSVPVFESIIGPTMTVGEINAVLQSGDTSIGVLPGRYEGVGYSSSTSNLKLCGIGNPIFVKNANGDLITLSGQGSEIHNILFYGDDPDTYVSGAAQFTGNNITFTEAYCSLYNCGSKLAYGRAVLCKKGHFTLMGTRGAYATTDSSGTGYDIELGDSASTTATCLYNQINAYYSSQSQGGILETNTGATKIVGGQFHKLTKVDNGSPSGINGGETMGARITGPAVIGISNSKGACNHFSHDASLTLGTGTSNHSWDASNQYDSGATITNNGNRASYVCRQIGEAGIIILRFGDNTNYVDMEMNPSVGSGYLQMPAYKVAGVQVVGARGAAVADATDAASAITQLNALLARCRAHGLIA